MLGYNLQAFHSGPYVFLVLAVCFPKTAKATAAIKKRPLEGRQLEVHTTG